MSKLICSAFVTALTLSGAAKAETVKLPEYPGISESSHSGFSFYRPLTICADHAKANSSPRPGYEHGTQLYSAKVSGPPKKTYAKHLLRRPVRKRNAIKELECKDSSGGLSGVQYMDFLKSGFVFDGVLSSVSGGGSNYASPNWFCLKPHSLRSALVCRQIKEVAHIENSPPPLPMPFPPIGPGPIVPPPTVPTVPEMSTWLMCLFGFAGVGLVKARYSTMRRQDTGCYKNKRNQPTPV